jgi:hypothetical protein
MEPTGEMQGSTAAAAAAAAAAADSGASPSLLSCSCCSTAPLSKSSLAARGAAWVRLTLTRSGVCSLLCGAAALAAGWSKSSQAAAGCLSLGWSAAGRGALLVEAAGRAGEVVCLSWRGECRLGACAARWHGSGTHLLCGGDGRCWAPWERPGQLWWRRRRGRVSGWVASQRRLPREVWPRRGSSASSPGTMTRRGGPRPGVLLKGVCCGVGVRERVGGELGPACQLGARARAEQLAPTEPHETGIDGQLTTSKCPRTSLNVRGAVERGAISSLTSCSAGRCPAGGTRAGVCMIQILVVAARRIGELRLRPERAVGAAARWWCGAGRPGGRLSKAL